MTPPSTTVVVTDTSRGVAWAVAPTAPTSAFLVGAEDGLAAAATVVEQREGFPLPPPLSAHPPCRPPVHGGRRQRQ